MASERAVGLMRLICVLGAFEAAGVAIIAAIDGPARLYLYAGIALACSALSGALSLRAAHVLRRSAVPVVVRATSVGAGRRPTG